MERRGLEDRAVKKRGMRSAERGMFSRTTPRAAIPHSAFHIPHSDDWMSQDWVEALLAAYGILTPRGAFARDVEGALTAAEEVGYPVALKLEAPGVTHKTDVGGVALDIRTPGQLRTEFEAMMQRVDGSGIRDQAVYVQRMAKGAAELIVGVTRDPQFGPLVMAGTGGIQVELKRDVAFELAPLSAKQAEEMLDRTSAGKLLAGFRGSPACDRASAVDVILRLSQIALDCPEVQEIEINPLIVMEQGEGAVAIDARVRLATGDR